MFIFVWYYLEAIHALNVLRGHLARGDAATLAQTRSIVDILLRRKNEGGIR